MASFVTIRPDQVKDQVCSSQAVTTTASAALPKSANPRYVELSTRSNYVYLSVRKTVTASNGVRVGTGVDQKGWYVPAGVAIYAVCEQGTVVLDLVVWEITNA